MSDIKYYIKNNYLYVKGNNSHGQLGVNSNKKYITKYTKIPIYIEKEYIDKVYIELYEYKYVNFFYINNNIYYAGWKYELTKNPNDIYILIKKIKIFFIDGYSKYK